MRKGDFCLLLPQTGNLSDDADHSVKSKTGIWGELSATKNEKYRQTTQRMGAKTAARMNLPSGTEFDRQIRTEKLVLRETKVDAENVLREARDDR